LQQQDNAMEMQTGTSESGTVVVRELTSAQDLQAYFRLRNDVFCEVGHFTGRAQTVDIDAYDSYSRFLGAFDGSSGQLMAGTRMILAHLGPHADLVRTIGHEQAIDIPDRPSTYPSQMAFKADWFVELCVNHGFKLVEFGRMVCRKGFRLHGIGGMLVHAVHGLGILHGMHFGLSSCPLYLADFYRKHGCKVIGTVGVSKFPGTDTDVVALLSDLQFLTADGLPAQAAKALASGGMQI
jgi:hypothetical protein